MEKRYLVFLFERVNALSDFFLSKRSFVIIFFMKSLSKVKIFFQRFKALILFASFAFYVAEVQAVTLSHHIASCDSHHDESSHHKVPFSRCCTDCLSCHGENLNIAAWKRSFIPASLSWSIKFCEEMVDNSRKNKIFKPPKFL